MTKSAIASEIAANERQREFPYKTRLFSGFCFEKQIPASRCARISVYFPAICERNRISRWTTAIFGCAAFFASRVARPFDVAFIARCIAPSRHEIRRTPVLAKPKQVIIP